VVLSFTTQTLSKLKNMLPSNPSLNAMITLLINKAEDNTQFLEVNSELRNSDPSYVIED
jgi:hypothetical protein